MKLNLVFVVVVLFVLVVTVGTIVVNRELDGGEGLEEVVRVEALGDVAQHVRVLGHVRLPHLELLLPVVDLGVDRLHRLVEVGLDVRHQVVAVLFLVFVLG